MRPARLDSVGAVGALLPRAMRSAAIAAAIAFVTIRLGASCAAIPDLTFAADAGDATSADGTISPTDTGLPDETSSRDASLPDAADSSPPDAGAIDASDALACLPANAPPDAGCCYGVLPCIGRGCGYCSACIAKGCHTNQYCCAQLNGQGAFQGVQCSGDGKNCP
jgi:hypothetical protein